uniref:Uncharacterized protein n=1 Tax=Nelumbo nucifera TaxID=4432 RepID=A0A822XNE5_NELNU|nr:TPA_asm: hypothetical protein HUJ06_024597 [Nelumbo nucifera]
MRLPHPQWKLERDNHRYCATLIFEEYGDGWTFLGISKHSRKRAKEKASREAVEQIKKVFHLQIDDVNFVKRQYFEWKSDRLEKEVVQLEGEVGELQEKIAKLEEQLKIMWQQAMAFSSNAKPKMC